jgi:hypothetical protein
MLSPIVMFSWATTGAKVARPTTEAAVPNAATIAIATNKVFESINPW